MKIKKDVLLNFLKISSMSGVALLNECILDFTKDGIVINAISASNGVFINARLKKDCIEGYKDFGAIAVQSLQDIVKLLEGFSGNTLKFYARNNELIFFSINRRVKITLMDLDIIKKIGKFPENLKKGMEIKIDISILKGFMENMGVVDSAEFSINVKNNKLIFQTKEFNEVIERIKIKEEIGDEINLIFNRVFPDAIKNLKGEIILSLKTNHPATIELNTEKIKIKMLIAPVIEKEE